MSQQIYTYQNKNKWNIIRFGVHLKKMYSLVYKAFKHCTYQKNKRKYWAVGGGHCFGLYNLTFYIKFLTNKCIISYESSDCERKTNDQQIRKFLNYFEIV